MSFLAARDLSVRYGERVAVDGIDLTLERGERLALIGPNGSGKTTLVKALAGIVRPSRGEVSLDGRAVGALTDRERARRFALVPQTFDTPFAFAAREIVALGRTPHARPFGRLADSDHDAIARAMTDVDATDLADRPFGELSGGERQRVILAMALAQQSDILLLDEPTAHLDLAHELRVLDLVRELARSRDLTVIAVLHDVALAASHFERVVVLHRGRVAADGPAADIVTAPLLARVFAVAARVYWHEGVAAIVPRISTDRSGRSARVSP